MAIKNTLKGGTNWSDGDILYAADLNDTFNSFYQKAYADNTGGSATSTSETDLASVTVTQNDLGTSPNGSNVTFLVTASCQYDGDGATATTGTFRLYIGGVVKRTITIEESSSLANDDRGVTFTYLETGNDVTAGNIIVKVSGQTDQSGSDYRCLGLTVLAWNEN